MDDAARVKDFIETSFSGPESGALGFEDSLLDSGLIDSTGIFELVSFLEETFGIEVQDEEIVPENFETVQMIASFVNGKRAA